VHPDLESRLSFLVERTWKIKLCLVHGDVSPKNILVGGEGAAHSPAHFPVFLDAECAWYGDPAFDLAFCLNHLLLKCLWVPAKRAAFLSCFDALSTTYLKEIRLPDVEERAATLLPALLLARVDGKSPVEYLTQENKEVVRSVARELLLSDQSLREIAGTWRRSLT
jgi:Ser/Thr protein kinase RdoA (MazF antagonist)